MKPGEGRSVWRLAQHAVAWLWLALLTGCVGDRAHLDRAMNAARHPTSVQAENSQQYRPSCPDVLEVTVLSVGDWPSGTFPIAVDGRIEFGRFGRVRVEGMPIGEITEQIAAVTGLPTELIRVRVADYRSQQIYIVGQVNGLQRAVAFRGEETVLELLQRAGGIAPGAEPDDVQVIRAHVADGGRPEVFTVHLHDIVMKKDLHTNVRLEPFDQVFIGETKRSCWEKCLPMFLRPIYERICGLAPSSPETPNNPSPPAGF